MIFYISLVLYHPQHSVSVLIVLATISVLTSTTSYFNRLPIRLIATPTVVLMIGILWKNAFAFELSRVILVLVQGGNAIIQNAAQHTGTVGSSIPSLFIKVFLVKTILGGAAGLLGAYSIYDVVRNESDFTQKQVAKFSIGVTPVFGLSVVLFASGSPNQFFRYFGLSLVVVTIIFSVFLSRVLSRSDVNLRTAMSIILIFGVIVALPAMYKSPYIGKPSQHVTQNQVSGYEFMFEYENPDIPKTSFQTQTYRYRIYLNGYRGAINTTNPAAIQSPRDTALHSYLPYDSLETKIGDSPPMYIVSTKMAKDIHLTLYGGSLYSNNDFWYVKSSTKTNNIYTSGDYGLYMST